ncbi:S-layer homology domain-containing protein [Paenibacillus sp. MMO-58]|uniref:S-layer homology domain-containing protein n=1 Tax=Paenibacillus sp. MMO-58 TaxID=3081290 RepID=UPI003016F594
MIYSLKKIRKMMTAFTALSILSVVTMFGSVANADSTVETQPVLNSVTIFSDETNIPIVTGTTKVHLEGHFSDNSSVDYTNDATWTSNNTMAASISPNGVITAGRMGGTVTITGTYGGLTSTVNITVTSLAPPPPPNEFYWGLIGGIEGAHFNLKYHQPTSPIPIYANYSDMTQIEVTSLGTWSSEDEQVAIVKDGIITPVGIGKTKINFTLGTEVLYILVDVNFYNNNDAQLTSLRVDETNMNLHVGDHGSINVKGVFSDNTEEALSTSIISFSSSNEAVATINPDGVITTLAAGQTTLTATVKGLPPVTITLTTDLVLDHVEISPIPTKIPVGQEIDPEVKAYYTNGSVVDVTDDVEWTSSNSNVISITNLGHVTALAPGEAAIIANVPGLDSAFTNIKVTDNPVSLSLNLLSMNVSVGDTDSLTVTATYQDGRTEDITDFANWSSDNEAIVIMSNKGVYTAIASGQTKIRVSYGTASTSLDLKVHEPNSGPNMLGITISPSPLNLVVGSSQFVQVLLNYDNDSTEDVTGNGYHLSDYLTDNSSVATVDNFGNVTAVGVGSTKLTVNYLQYSDQITINVNAADNSSNNTSGSGTIPSPLPENPTKPVPTVKKPVLKEVFSQEAIEATLEKEKQASPISFTDVQPTDWHAEIVERASKMGIIQGFDDGSFRPDEIVTRIQFAFMVGRAFGIPIDETEGSNSSYLEALIHAGILTGYTDGTYRPDQKITRAEIVTILSRLVDYAKVENTKFTDVKANWAADAINAFAAAEIVKGKTETNFDPNASSTRAEAIAILIRLLDKLVE